MLILRDMRESDIEDYVRWFTAETSWGETDAPWEPFEGDTEAERESWTEIWRRAQTLPADALRRRLEIEADGRHIGWVCSYEDTGLFPNPDGSPAVGIDIAEPSYRGKGCGTQALRQFIEYFRAHGFTRLYAQTWSGNRAMLALAQKLGFQEIYRVRAARLVNGQPYDALTLALDL